MLKTWVLDAIRAHGGSATIVEVAKHVWEHHQDAFETGDWFYTWQYDVRWAAHALRKEGRMRPAEVSPRGVWELAA